MPVPLNYRGRESDRMSDSRRRHELWDMVSVVLSIFSVFLVVGILLLVSWLRGG